jgi:hypothetical protein
VTEAVSHLLRACGSRGFPFGLGFPARAFFFLRFCAGVLIMSSGVHGTGAPAVSLRRCGDGGGEAEAAEGVWSAEGGDLLGLRAAQPDNHHGLRQEGLCRLVP